MVRSLTFTLFVQGHVVSSSLVLTTLAVLVVAHVSQEP